MGPTSVVALAIAVVFLVPGFIWETSLGLFVVRTTKTRDLSVLGYLAFGAVNFAFWWFTGILTPNHLAAVAGGSPPSSVASSLARHA